MNSLTRKMQPVTPLVTIALIVVASLAASDAKPIETQVHSVDQYSTNHHETDPMMALPSGQEARISGAEREVQYVRYELQGAGPQEASMEYQQPAAQPAAQQDQQVVVYRQAEEPAATYQLSRQPHQHGDGVPCAQRHQEYAPQQQQQQQHRQQQSQDTRANQEQVVASETPRGEYPGEIIYVGQNGEVIAPQAESEPQPLGEVAGSLAQHSGMAATILTEVPVKDMPANVLEKLKREYGVKVVATRERPGANLVINCDEYSGQESTICGRAAPHSHAVYESVEAQHPQAPNGEQIVYVPQPAYSAAHVPPTGEQEPAHVQEEANYQSNQGQQQQQQQYHQHSATPTRTVYVTSADEGATLTEQHQGGEEQQHQRHNQPQFEHREIVYTSNVSQPNQSEAPEELPRQPAAAQEARASGPRDVSEERDYAPRGPASSAPQSETATEPTTTAQENMGNVQDEAQYAQAAPRASTTIAYARHQQDTQTQTTSNYQQDSTMADGDQDGFEEARNAPVHQRA